MSELLLEVKKIIEEEKNLEVLHEKLMDVHPYDFAQIFGELTTQERQEIYDVLHPDEIADIIEYIEDNDLVLSILSEMPKREGAEIIDEMERDDAADILKEEGASKYLELLDNESKEELEYLIKHDDGTAASIMTTDYVELALNDDVKDAMRKLFENASEKETIDPLFVTDNGILVGILPLKELIMARSPKAVSEIMDKDFIYSNVDDDIMEASKKIHNYGLYALPILEDGLMKGIITMDDAIDTIDEEVTEDYEKLAGVSDIDESLGFIKNIKSRLPWLLVLLVLSFLVSFVMSGFDEVISQVTVLVFFQTLILDMSGNSGTQSLAVTVRGISNYEYEEKKSIFKKIFKEFRIGLCNGIIMSILAFVSAFIFLSMRNTTNNLQIAFVIAMSMGFALLASGIIGSAIPIILYKLHIDPAVASGPFITTISDIISILIYFSIAQALLLGGGLV